MSINLIESEHRTQRSVRSTFVSIAAHACIITFAVYASANAVEPRPRPEVYVDVFPPRPNEPTRAPIGPAHPVTSPNPQRTPNAPRTPISIPTTVPTTLPPIETSHSTVSDSTLFGSASSPDSGASGSGARDNGGDSGEPLFAAQVEKPAIPRNGNPSPKYPSFLESSRVEGIVLVQFVVDTLGVAEMGTFKVLDATDDLFAESTRASIAKWRFYPAEAGGRKVKQIVQLPLRFVAPRR